MRVLLMDAERANEYFDRYSFIVFDESIPSHDKFYVSLDDQNLSIGASFRGFKLIPPGFHILSLYLANTEDNSSSTGFSLPISYAFKICENISLLLIIKFDPVNEDWILEIDETKLYECRRRLRDLDPYLGSYPFERWDSWKNLSSCVTQNMLDRILAAHHKFQISTISTITKSFSDDKTSIEIIVYKIISSLMSSHYNATESLLGLKTRETAEVNNVSSSLNDIFHFPSLDHVSLGLSPNQITQNFILDSSFLLLQALKKYYNNDISEYIGEQQFAFLVLLCCCNYEGFEHWKAVTKILCRCKKLILEYMDSFLKWITIFEQQCYRLPIEWRDALEREKSDNWILHHLQIFWGNIDDLVHEYVPLRRDNQEIFTKVGGGILEKKLKILEEKSIIFQKNIEKQFNICLERGITTVEADEEPIIIEDLCEG